MTVKGIGKGADRLVGPAEQTSLRHERAVHRPIVRETEGFGGGAATGLLVNGDTSAGTSNGVLLAKYELRSEVERLMFQLYMGLNVHFVFHHIVGIVGSFTLWRFTF